MGMHRAAASTDAGSSMGMFFEYLMGSTFLGGQKRTL